MNTHFKVILGIILFFLSISMPAQASGLNDASVIISGEKRILASKVLGEDRTLLISLPKGYESNNTRHYPVLYALDGETHFQHINGTVDWLSNQAIQIPQMIIVAITNTQRGRDMTASYNNGGADHFLKFIQGELIPYIDTQYRTQPFRILSGHSMAGHLALNVFNQSPQLFNAYIAMSPFFLQDRGETKLVERLNKQLSDGVPGNPFIYASIGDETRLMPMFQAFEKGLEKAGKNLRWQSFVSADDTHMSIASNTINNALRFIFQPLHLAPDSEIAKQGVTAIKAYYRNISKEIYGYTISPEPAINQLGYHLIFTQKAPQKALDVFQANVALFPFSPNAHDSLAEGYKHTNQYTQALESVEKAIAFS